jgi:putative membrane protein
MSAVTLRCRWSGVAAAALLATSSAGAFAASKSTDTTFLRNAIRGDIAEVQMGQLAEQKSQDPDVKALGQMLVADHGQARTEAETVAKTMKIHIPTAATKQATTEYQKLSGLSGKAFDQEFANFMVTAHNKDITMFQTEAKSGTDAAAQLAQRTAPVLQKHLEMAQALVKKLGA